MPEKKGRKGGLGKGLGALFTEPVEDILNDASLSDPKDTISLISISDIEPNKNQPRKNFDSEKLEALASSIKENGVLSPLLVTRMENGQYLIVAGERRWRASKLAGLKKVPCIVKTLDDYKVSELALVENLQRDDLNPIEEAMGYEYLINKFSLTQEEISEKVGKSRSAVANALRLNNLTDEVKELVKDGTLSSGHARTLLSLNSENQSEAAKTVIQNGLSVRQTEALVKSLLSGKKPTYKKAPNSIMQKYYKDLENNLSSKFGTKVKITDGAKKGKIEIEYYNKDDFERILFELNR